MIDHCDRVKGKNRYSNTVQNGNRFQCQTRKEKFYEKVSIIHKPSCSDVILMPTKIWQRHLLSPLWSTYADGAYAKSKLSCQKHRDDYNESWFFFANFKRFK